MATARELIDGALRLIGQLAEGETPSNETLNDSLLALNQMLESWSLERINVFRLQDQSVVWPANEVTRTFGPTGQLVGVRPVSIDHAFTIVDSIKYPILLVTDEQYNDFPDPSTVSSTVWALRASMAVPDIELTFYPIPNENVELHLMSVLELSQPATLFTELVIPPGYLKAFRYNLALELSSEFGKAPAAGVIVGAQQSKAAIQRVNTPLDTLRMPGDMPGLGGW